MEHNVYACDHYVEPGPGSVTSTRHLLGMLDSDEQRSFGEYKRERLPTRCRERGVHAFCYGGCPKNSYLETLDGELGLNYLCAGYRRFFTHVQPYLDIFERVVERGRLFPAVMDVVEARDCQETR